MKLNPLMLFLNASSVLVVWSCCNGKFVVQSGFHYNTVHFLPFQVLPLAVWRVYCCSLYSPSGPSPWSWICFWHKNKGDKIFTLSP